MRWKHANWKTRLAILALLVIAGLVGWAVIARSLAPTSNTSLAHFDAIIVLGYPADSDGNPTPIQLSRVSEAVREYERGVAPRMIVSGAATRHGFVEAEVMARTARAEGIPASAIILENQAKDTIQNACYSVRIMKNHGWQSAEVVSTDSHLPRAAMIFGDMPILWRTHAAPLLTPHFGWGMEFLGNSVETLKTARYLLWTRHTEHCEP